MRIEYDGIEGDTDSIQFGDLTIWLCHAEPGQPLCIVDAGGAASVDNPMLARSLELYLNDAGFIVGVRVSRHIGVKKNIIEIEIGDVQPLAELGDEDNA